MWRRKSPKVVEEKWRREKVARTKGYDWENHNSFWDRKTVLLFIGTLKLVKRASRDLGLIIRKIKRLAKMRTVQQGHEVVKK